MRITRLLTLALGLLLMLPATAQNTVQKREMRSAWVATVWQLDWPSVLITSTGNELQIKQQQRQMTMLLDSLAINNFNAINFQVRSRSDAMYRSSYEPWSTDLVKTRGMDPGWDPLEWVVAECHKRGMECHAWVNPYRYESVTGQWNGTPNAYRDTHPEWIMDVGTASILNPGLPEVTQRICDVITEIVENYDVDGVLFDDYFYLSGTNESHDGDLYRKYTSGGGKLSIGDWRRQNVNNMIATVYRTIKSVKPWVRFGVSPAGIACTSTSVANKYGIPKCPTGSDWQYNGIYSDPIAWVSERSLDFISPQIYWTLGASTNYGRAAEWWSMVANKWGRHLYVSHSISSLNLGSRAPERSGMEENIARGVAARASGPGNETYAEYANQVLFNREHDLNGAPGSIFYSAKYIYNTSPKFGHYLLNHVFGTKALVPAITWQSAPAQGLVEGLQRSGSTLSWQPVDNVRYTVYAYPENMPAQNFLREAEYLLGVSYEPQFTIPAGKLTGMQYAVCILDRYGNEYTPALLGVPSTSLTAPKVLAPADGATVEAPFDFEWEAVEGASEYIVEIAGDRAMTERIDQRSTTATSISTEVFAQLPIDRPVYWRIRACGAGNADGVSPVYELNVNNLLITAPANFAEGTTLTPTFTYSIPEREVTLEISTTDAFKDADIVYTVTATGTITVPRFTLMAATPYYSRLRYMRNGVEKTTPTVMFTTLAMEAAVPSVAHPVAGGTLRSNERIRLADIEGACSLTLQVSASESFPPRTSYTSSKVSLADMTDAATAGEIKISGKTLEDGQTYYVRARSAYNSLDAGLLRSEYSEPVSFVYSATAGVAAPAAEADVLAVDGRVVTANVALSDVRVYDLAGADLAVVGNLAAGQSVELHAPAGVYLVQGRAAGKAFGIKIAIK